MSQWEYRIESLNLDIQTAQCGSDSQKTLNDLGGEGWEAVAVWPLHEDGLSVCALFKRPKSK